MRLDSQPVISPKPASTTALSSRGGTTTSAASTTVTARNASISRRCGRAKPSTRRSVRRSILLSTTLRSLRRCRHGGPPAPGPIDMPTPPEVHHREPPAGPHCSSRHPHPRRRRGRSAREGGGERAEPAYLRLPLQAPLLVEVAVARALEERLGLGDDPGHG